MSVPSLPLTAEAVWGISPENLTALRELRDFRPAASSDPQAFLRDCQAHANRLLESPNLREVYESNASAALRPEARLSETRTQLEHWKSTEEIVTEGGLDWLLFVDVEVATILRRERLMYLEHYGREPLEVRTSLANQALRQDPRPLCANVSDRDVGYGRNPDGLRTIPAPHKIR